MRDARPSSEHSEDRTVWDAVPARGLFFAEQRKAVGCEPTEHLSRRCSGELPELAHQVRLIVEPTIQREVRPAHGSKPAEPPPQGCNAVTSVCDETTKTTKRTKGHEEMFLCVLLCELRGLRGSS